MPKYVSSDSKYILSTFLNETYPIWLACGCSPVQSASGLGNWEYKVLGRILRWFYRPKGEQVWEIFHLVTGVIVAKKSPAAPVSVAAAAAAGSWGRSLADWGMTILCTCDDDGEDGDVALGDTYTQERRLRQHQVTTPTRNHTKHQRVLPPDTRW